MASLRPFWKYYGGKWRAAPKYPSPMFQTIVEPFAGAAGYSLRYPHLRVILIEKYAVIAEMWRYLIGVSESEFRLIPTVDAVADLPVWVPAGGRALVGFAMNTASTRPCRVLSSGQRQSREAGRRMAGWSEFRRDVLAAQLQYIRHWRIIEGDFSDAPDQPATYFVDPPYVGMGFPYAHSEIDYESLAGWCRSRKGQVLVCENDGADWLPFQPFAVFKQGTSGNGAGAAAGSKEVLWRNTTVEDYI